MTVNFDGSTFQEDELSDVVLKIKAQVAMLEGVRYASNSLDAEFWHVGSGLRKGLDDSISELTSYAQDIEEVIGTVTPPSHATAPAIAQTLESLTGLRANTGEA